MPKKPTRLIRTDVLPHAMNAGKQAKVRALLKAWRQAAVREASIQWKLFFTTGAFNKMRATKGEPGLPAAHKQRVAYQVVGQLDSWLGNRANDYRELVNGSSLDAETKHQLHFINKTQAWYQPGAVTMKSGVIPAEVRKLARCLMRQLQTRHRKPNLAHASMVLDTRGVTLAAARTSQHHALWARLSTLDKGSRLEVPLLPHYHYAQRKGQRLGAIQVSERGGALVFGVLTDVTETYAKSTAAYIPRTDEIGLDIGLSTLFATDQGDLLGRGWLAKLRNYDARITKLAAYRQKHQLPVKSSRYAGYVQQMRGFVQSEVNRLLKRLVAVHAPATIVVERLNFQNSNLSRRMNRLLSTFGKRAIAAKLKDLTERYGIEVVEVNPAYTSQECSGCGYVAKNNRPSQAVFHCKACGHQLHADVNGARTIRRRRSTLSQGGLRTSRRVLLEALIVSYLERIQRGKGTAPECCATNAYFKGRLGSMTSIVISGGLAASQH